jgi:probable F420-dependent oxidoreductase
MAATVERLGYSTVWLTGGPMTSLDQVRQVVAATETVKVATGIIAVVRFPADDVVALYADLERDHPGRFVVGLGGAHGPDPMGTLNAYLDRLEGAIPPERRVLATLGPRMQRLARERAAGALPVLVTPGWTAQARETLGPESTLAVEQFAVLATDPAAARRIARVPLEMLGQLPAYQANFRRMGFSEEAVIGRSDELVDGLVAWGEPAAVAARLDEHRRAGADHLAVNLLGDGGPATEDQWRRLAEVVLR